MLSPSIEMSYASPQSLTISEDSSSDDYRRSPPVVRPRPSPRNYAVATDYDTLLPLKNCKYFPPRTRQSETVVGVVIPFFNEGKAELKRTLESLYDQQVECGDLGVEFLYLAVMDGILMADPTMVEYISSLYKTNEWAEKMYMSDDTEYITVLHAAANDDADSSHGLVEIAPGKHLRLTFLIKGQNRRKTNSHEWFFVAYCREYEVDYAFATDCGTLYANGCLYYLIQYLSTHPEVSAVTGRQRVMSSTMQSLRTEGLMQMWYRAVQSYDYEASISSFLGAFSLMGMLPVIPGPAGLWRMSDCGGAPMDYYINYINNISAEDGLIKGNLLLAEDRILSYAVCLMTGKYTRWVPMAVFYTEAETDIKSFITQRRRWINGTMACYIFLLFASPGILFRGPHRLGFKLMIYSQLLIQTLLFGVTALSPGIFATLICFSVDTLHIGGAEWSRTIALAVAGISLCMYIIFCGLHFFHKFVRSFYEYLLIWNTVTFSVIVANVVVSFANKDVMTIVVLLLVVFFPFFLALLHSLDVFVMMLFSFFQFFLFLPTFLPYFSAYSYCRIWDLSWGNRPSSSSSENKESIEVVTDTTANTTSARNPAKKKMADHAHPKIDSRFDRSESVDTQSSEVNSWQSSSTFGSGDFIVPITSAKTKIGNGTKIAKGGKIDLSKVKYNEFSSADIASQTRMVSAADDRVAKKASKKNRQRRTLSTKRKHRLMGLLILLIVMVANVLVAGVFIWTEQMNALMILTLGLVGMALCQQILSFLFYLFYSEHMITAGVQSMSRNWTKLLSATLFITTIVCLYTGALTTHWLTNSIDIYLPGNGTYVLNNTVVAYQGPVESEVDSMIFYTEEAGDVLLDRVNFTDVNIKTRQQYAVETKQTDSIIYNLDPQTVKRIRDKFGQYKFSAFYVNISTITTTLVNTTLAVDGAADVIRDVKTKNIEYLNISYYDDYGNVFEDITTNPFENYTKDFLTIDYSNQTLTRTDLAVEYEKYDGYVNMKYGLFRISYDYHTKAGYKSETRSWGGDLMFHYPNQMWAFTLLLVAGALTFMAMILTATIYAFFVKDKSRVYGIAVVYVWFTICTLMLAILMFPVSFANLQTYHVGWWNPENPKSSLMCGESANYYNSGDCSVGWSYMLVVFAFFTAVFSYHTTRIALDKPKGDLTSAIDTGFACEL